MAKKLSTTPKGVAVYPHLSKPDTKFNKDGVYHVKVKLAGKEAEAFVKQIDEAIKAKVLETKEENKKKAAEAAKAGKKGKTPAQIKLVDPPYKRVLDDDEEPTGEIEFSFKMNAKGTKKNGEVFERQPAIFDKSGTPATGLRIGGGSTIKVSYELNPFSTALGVGCSLRLYAVQVIELVEFGGNGEYFGFKNEEEEGEASPAKTVTEEVEEAAEEAETDDF